MPDQRYKSVGYCIYCGERSGVFSDEHVVPFSLGGNIVLPQASCEDCQKHIHGFETQIATETYLSFRSAQRFPSRTKSLLKHLPVQFTAGLSSFERLIPIDDAPVPAIIPSFGLPPYLPGSSPMPGQLSILPMDDRRWKRTFRHCHEAESATITSSGIRLEYFVRLIMKIAYGFAWLVDPECAFNWDGRRGILTGNFPSFPLFEDIFSVPASRDRDELFCITVFTNPSDEHHELFCQLEILTGIKVPAYVVRIGRTQIKHPFGLEFAASRGIWDIGGMQMRLPPTSHLR